MIAGSLLVAGACSPVGDPALGASDATPAQSDRTLVYGFEVIKERYLTEVNFGTVAFEGLRGLSLIDPTLTFENNAPRRILVSYRKQRLAEYPTPTDDDADGWAELIQKIARDTAAVSPELKKAGTEAVYQAVFDATLAKLDMFSRYAGATEAREHRAARNGFGGIGVRYEAHEADITLTEVMPETPASRANLRVGDHVLAVDGHSVVGLNQDDITKLLRGPIASPVALTVRPKDAQQAAVVSLKRSLIVPPTVTMAMKDGIATIAISSFNQSTVQNVTESLKTAKATPGFRGVMLDLRGNGGGLLDQGVGVADLFMDHGRIVSTKGRNSASVQSYDAKPGDIGEDVSLVVLVDGKSASASEIVASALQDSGRAVVVGTNSYGKGTVQTVVRLPNDGEMTLTWSRYYSPAGYALHGLGVLPAICTADEKAGAAALLAMVREGRSPVGAEIAVWRSTTVEDVAERKQLRTSCPSAKQGDLPLDAELGRELIADHALYAQTLSLTAPVTTASTSPALVPGNSP